VAVLSGRSDAHLNPAVTLGLRCGRDRSEVPARMSAAQLLGAMLDYLFGWH